MAPDDDPPVLLPAPAGLPAPPRPVRFDPRDWGIDPRKVGRMPLRPRRGAGAAAVIGAEDRMRIGMTGSDPWRLVCALVHHRDGRARPVGTGTLVGPRLVLTAGHCLAGDGGEIEVIPGLNAGDGSPYGSRRVSAAGFRMHPAWRDNRREERDAGALVLDRPFDGIDTWFEIAGRADEALIGWFVSIAGYPAIRPRMDENEPRYDGGDELWFHSNAITDARPRELHYGIDTTAGQSGSAVWLYDADRPAIVGIHAYGSRRGNFATRMDDDLIAEIRSWSPD